MNSYLCDENVSLSGFCIVYAIKTYAMKKLSIILLSLTIALSGFAQHRYAGRHYYRPRTTVVVSGGYYPYYPVQPYSYWGYRPYYRPSRLALEIEDIQSDYRDRIWSVRHDDRLTKKERKRKIHELKSDRDVAIRNAERNYYRSY
jgi:hypothetical protein